MVCRGRREIKAPTSYSWFLSTTPYTWQNPGPLGSQRSEVQCNCIKYTFPACFMSTAKLQHGLQQKDGCWSCLPTFLLSVAVGHLYKPAVQSGQTGRKTKAWWTTSSRTPKVHQPNRSLLRPLTLPSPT